MNFSRNLELFFLTLAEVLISLILTLVEIWIYTCYLFAEIGIYTCLLLNLNKLNMVFTHVDLISRVMDFPFVFLLSYPKAM